MCLVSCISTKEIKVIRVPTCKPFKFIMVSKDDQLTLDTARQLVTHNELLEECIKNYQ